MKLYEINAQIEALLIPDENGELAPDAIERLDALNLEREQKVLDIACWIKGLRAEADALKAEEVALAMRRKALENRTANLTNYLRTAIPEGEKLKDARTQITWRKSTGVVIEDEAQVPQEFWKQPAPVVSLTAISDALKSGHAVPGAVLETRENLQIK